uniref:Carboxypeptidase n=1 Tax=Caenorhabditis tropicalis TaxID=1561998 RepID=A0A1I7T6B7_9PELO
MFYFLLEARDVPFDEAPLIIWFNGGPGCSSLGAFFEEFGPLYINFDGKSLFENVHSWYHKANILFLESPIGVGFSYDKEVKNVTKADDDGIAQQNFNAVVDFFENKHPSYINHNFFIAAESYGGVYGPMLSALVAESIDKNEFPNENFQGLMIGNGFMNVKLSTNTMILWSAYHARTSPDEWDSIKEHCKTPGAKDVDDYDFMCGRLIEPLLGQFTEDWTGYDFFNYYHDCYTNFSLANSTDPVKETLKLAPRLGISALLNKYSTDDKASYSCWADVALPKYLNLNEVKKALNLDREWLDRKEKWKTCNMEMYDQYVMTHQDMTPFFSKIFNNYTGPAFRVLIYNGDLDTACNYLADGYFVRDLAKKNDFKKTVIYQPWFYSANKVLSGYYMRYEGENDFGSKLSIDVVTVKGAGHFVPLDRPGPSYQMINNFLFAKPEKLANYTLPI